MTDSDVELARAATAAFLHGTNAEACQAFQGLLETVGRRWTGAILMASMMGARRFGEYRGLVRGISDRMLSQRLKELESLGLLDRTVIPTTPVQILYAPSQRGRDLVMALRPLIVWGGLNLPDALDDRDQPADQA